MRKTNILLTNWGAWLPAATWCIVIFLGSTDAGGGQQNSRRLVALLHWLLPFLEMETTQTLAFIIRKFCHLTEYAILVNCWYYGFCRSFLIPNNRVWSPFFAAISLLICVSYAASDEYHQSLTSERFGCISDVIIDSTVFFASFIPKAAFSVFSSS